MLRGTEEEGFTQWSGTGLPWEKQHYCCELSEDRHSFLFCFVSQVPRKVPDTKEMLNIYWLSEGKEDPNVLHFHLILPSNSCIGFYLHLHIYENHQQHYKPFKGKNGMSYFFVSHTVPRTRSYMSKTFEINRSWLAEWMFACCVCCAYKPRMKDYKGEC